MKILYELVITKETGFTDTDFPDRFEILRGKGKTPLVFKPVAVNLQAIYARLQEAEELLIKAIKSESNYFLNSAIVEYFERHKQ